MLAQMAKVPMAANADGLASAVRNAGGGVSSRDKKDSILMRSGHCSA